MSKRQTAFVDFTRVREEVGIDDVLRHYGVWDTLKGRGPQLRGPCPIHGGSNPRQFTINLKKQVWHCFGDCKDGGNVLEFVVAMEGCTLREAGLKLAEWFDLPVEGKRKKAARAPKAKTDRVERQASDDDPQGSGEESEEDDKAPSNVPLTFERLKHLDPEHASVAALDIAVRTAHHFGIGYCSRGIMRGHVAIPVHNLEGALLAYAGVNPDDRLAPLCWPNGFRPELEVFNAHRARSSKALRRNGLIVVQNFLDVIALHETGRDNAVAMLGDYPSLAQRQIIEVLCEEMRQPRIHFACPQERLDNEPPHELIGWLACIAPVRAVSIETLTD